jgi:hypothetical protein
MAKRLLTKSKIFFPNPYVVRLDHEETGATTMSVSYRSALKIARKNLGGTWGCSQPEYEVIQKISPVDFTALTSANQLTAIFTGSGDGKYRSYWCFADEMDALQFRLSVECPAIQVFMWPDRWFTVTEITDEY